MDYLNKITLIKICLMIVCSAVLTVGLHSRLSAAEADPVLSAKNVQAEASARGSCGKNAPAEDEPESQTSEINKTANPGVSAACSSKAGMILIESGEFSMGYNYYSDEWWYPTETPVHTVYVSAFMMDKYEVSGSLWDEVYIWAIDNGYDFDNPGEAQGDDHPVYNINWYDAVKWCNAKSEKNRLNTVYYTDTTQTTVYRRGNIDLEIGAVKWEKDGYRLPTEAEWEKAARGGLTANHYPWPSEGGTYSDHIDGGKANYDGSNDPWESNLIPTAPVGYYDGNQTPPGSDMANGHGLYDMAGNVIEWVWDWYDNTWYGNPEAGGDDTRGPSSPVMGWKVLRGGSWHTGQVHGLRCALRLPQHTPSYTGPALGFRCVRSVENAVVYGDLNQNGRIEAADLAILKNYLVQNLSQGVAPFTAPLSVGDLNGDGYLDSLDFSLLSNRLSDNSVHKE